MLLLIICLPLLALVACQSKLIYFPRPYQPGITARWQEETKGRTIHFTTSEGKQQAFLQGNLKSPRRLWIVCAGNGSVALDWSDWLNRYSPAQDACLLVDYPGYGACEGSPTPGRIRESFQKCLPLAWQHLGWSGEEAANHTRFLGHSLGAAAALIAATEFSIKKGVLIAPFTSTMDMSRAVVGLPLGALVWHRFDNRARLNELSKMQGSQIIILHGMEDEVIPCAMSREMAAAHPTMIQLTEIPRARHNTIPSEHAAQIAAAMGEMGK